jgi:hypothetical protein
LGTAMPMWSTFRTFIFTSPSLIECFVISAKGAESIQPGA